MTCFPWKGKNCLGSWHPSASALSALGSTNLESEFFEHSLWLLNYGFPLFILPHETALAKPLALFDLQVGDPNPHQLTPADLQRDEVRSSISLRVASERIEPSLFSSLKNDSRRVVANIGVCWYPSLVFVLPGKFCHSNTLHLQIQEDVWNHSFWSLGPEPQRPSHAADSTPPACKLASVKSWPGYDIFGPLASQKKIELWHHGLTLTSKGGGCSCCYQITRENLYNIASWFKFPMGGFLALAHCHFSDRNPTLLSRVTDGSMADWRSWNMFQHAFFCSLSSQGLPFVWSPRFSVVKHSLGKDTCDTTTTPPFTMCGERIDLHSLNWHSTGQEANPKTKLYSLPSSIFQVPC